MIMMNDIDICCMHEIELKPDYDHNILTFKGYKLQIENNTIKSRVGIYIKSGIKYTR